MTTAPSTHDVFNFPPGYRTTEGTLRVMADVVKRRHTDPRMRNRVRSIFYDYNVPSADHDAEIAAVYDFIIRHIRYQRDPLGVEYITDPVTLDEQIDEGGAAEDCESLALYAATLFAAAGLPSEFDIMGPRAGEQRFTHCALAVQNPRTKAWTSFDPVGEYHYPGNFTLGDTIFIEGMARERWGLDGKRVGMGDFLETAFGDGAEDLQSAKKYGDPVANVVGTLGPYGALVSGLWQVGTGIAATQIPEKIPEHGTITGRTTPQPKPAPTLTPLKQATVGKASATSARSFLVPAALGLGLAFILTR